MTAETLHNNLPALFAATLVSILFLQSGIDKVIDRKGNVEWLTGHFSKTFLAGWVPSMLTQLTVLELLTGVLSAAGIVYFLITGSVVLIYFSSVIGATTVIGLFFGQRLAKDYPGAAVLVPYLILLLILMYLTGPTVRH